MGATANRCSNCNIDWPQNAEFQPCPKCGEKTSPMYREGTLALDAGRKLASTVRFEAFYEESRGVKATADGDPDGDPKRSELPSWCDCGERPPGVFCWACDPAPRVPPGELHVPEEWTK